MKPKDEEKLRLTQEEVIENRRKELQKLKDKTTLTSVTMYIPKLNEQYVIPLDKNNSSSPTTLEAQEIPANSLSFYESNTDPVLMMYTSGIGLALVIAGGLFLKHRSKGIVSQVSKQLTSNETVVSNLGAPVKAQNAKNVSVTNKFARFYVPLQGSKRSGEFAFQALKAKEDTTGSTPQWFVSQSTLTIPGQSRAIPVVLDKPFGKHNPNSGES